MHRFYKYQGAGNDFVVLDDRSCHFDIDNQSLIARLCDRNFGIGADGLMLLREREGFDFEMVYFNADGLQGTMCGNGGRCIVAFAHRMGIFSEETTFMAADGEHSAVLSGGQGVVKLKMADVARIEEQDGTYFLNTGSPHYIQFVDELQEYPVFVEGKRIRYAESFQPEGTNVNFVQALADGYAIRTYERGVENETLACGTGATAAAIAAIYKEGNVQMNAEYIVPIRALGGDLKVHFKAMADGSFVDVYLEGPATFVYEGLIDFDRLMGEDMK